MSDKRERLCALDGERRRAYVDRPLGDRTPLAGGAASRMLDAVK